MSPRFPKPTNCAPLIAVVVLSCAAFSPAGTASADACEVPDGAGLSPEALLRRLSLDLRGRIPTLEEYEAIAGEPEVSRETLLALLTGDEFRAELREVHRARLWPHVSRNRQPSVFVGERYVAPLFGGDILWSVSMSAPYRGQAFMRCLNQLQTEFDDAGRPVPIKTAEAYTALQCPGGGCRQEGYVLVAPWWAPDTTVKVCAFDAQAHTAGLSAPDCAVFNSDAGCGCGANLTRCIDGPLADRLEDALEEEPLRIFEETILARRPYSEALTTKTTYLNAPLARFYRYHTDTRALSVRNTRYDGPLPEFADDDPGNTWVPYERGEQHAGALTTPAFLMRFGSHRGRVNRFYSEFMCQPFAAAGVPTDLGECSKNPDLSKRCGCSTCHAVIEPAAVHWGRWDTQDGFGWLDTGWFPETNPGCATCTGGGCALFCFRHYVTPGTVSDEALLSAAAGQLLVTAFRTETEKEALLAGPAALLDRPGTRAAVASCTVRRTAERLWNRPLTEDEAGAWLTDMSAQFTEEGEDYLWLLEAVVADPRYRTP